MSRVTSWMRDFAEKQSFQPDNFVPLKSLNYVMAIQSAVVGFFLIGPDQLFLQPSYPPDDFWLAPSLFGIGLWEVIFLLCAAWLAISTSLLKGVSYAHTALGVFWLLFGVTWVIGGILASPSYLFGVGLLGIFISLQHVALAGVWRSEGV